MPRLTRDNVLIALIVVAALVVRIWLPWDRIFRGGYVSFQGDAWYHMRAVDSLVANFPHRLTTDPYATFGGQFIGMAPLFDYLIAGLALLLGLGWPSSGTVEMVGAMLPALLGGVSVVTVWLIGRRVFDARAALFAAAVVAIMPGHFLDRTLLGAADHHALEITLTLLISLWMIIALQGTPAASPRSAQMAPWLAGVWLGAFFLTWTSAPFLLSIIGLWMIGQCLLDRGLPRAPALVLRMAVVALGLVLLFQNPRVNRYGLQVGSLASLITLAAAAVLAPRSRTRMTRAVLLVGVLVGLMAGAVLLSRLHLPAVDGALDDVGRFFSSAPQPVAEAQPLLSMGGRFSMLNPWRIFGSAFYLAVPALLGLAVRVARRRSPGDALILTFATILFLATLGQNRFGYYLVPMMGLLAGWLSSELLAWTDRHQRVRGQQDFAAVAIAVFLFYPSLKPGLASIARDDGVPPAWHRALIWLRDQTPEPFDGDHGYLARYDRTSESQPAYSVMNWWDYGYWITRVSERVPVANPTQMRADSAAAFFLATNETFADAWLAEYHSRYAIVDRGLVLLPGEDPLVLHGKFASLPPWISRQTNDYFEQMVQRAPDGTLTSLWVFYPDYYRTMAVHLYFYGAEAVTPSNSTWVITFAQHSLKDGGTIKEILRCTKFPTFEAAEAYLQQLGPGPHRLVGLDPTRSSIALAALPSLRLVHEEMTATSERPAIRIFER